MMLLIVGLLIFFAVHLVPAQTELRAGFISRWGENAYKIGFSVLSLIGFVLIVLGYGKMQAFLGSKNPILWYPPEWTRHAASLLMLPAFIALVAAYIPSRLRTLLKHPMLVAIKLWALAHLMANGDVASLLLFGSFLAYAVYDRISLKRRPEDSGRGPLGSAQGSLAGDLGVVVVGLVLFAAMAMWGHKLLIGVSVMP